MNGIDDFSSGDSGWAAYGFGGGDQGFQDGPFLIGQVAGVRSAWSAHPSRIAEFYNSL